MNFFQYHTEIEDAFIHRRGKGLILTPKEWALIERWKEMGIPLQVVLGGIERVFARHEALPNPSGINSLAYCQREVEAQFAEWRKQSPDEQENFKG